MFTRQLYAVGLAAALLVPTRSAVSATSKSPLDFTLVNRAGLTITHVYVSPHDVDEWGDDIMGEDVIPHTKSVDITFDRSEDSCNWDLKVTDEDDDDIVWESLNLCKASKVTLKYENKVPTAIIE
jgi:hypothetical protein